VSDTASTHGAEFVFAVVILSSMIVGGAVLRVAGGVFYGLGEAPPEDARMAAADNEETSETEGHKDKTPLTMIGPAALLVLAALGIGLLPHLGNVLEHAAVQLEDQRGYNAAVLRGAVPRHPVALMAAEGTGVKVADVLSALGTAFGSLLLALAALYRNRIRVPRVRVDGLRRVMDSLQSGVVNDYITWMTLGVASLCGALLLSIR
jgi:multicomponent Na+:H+ antiporter subunit D